MVNDLNPLKRVEVAVGVLIDFEQKPWRVLITKRPAKGVLANYWEFPGGKREAAETLEECVVREFFEEVGLKVKVVDVLQSVEHSYPHAVVHLTPFVCRLESGEIRYNGVVDHQWVAIGDLPGVAFPAGNASMVAELMGYAGERNKG
jgi:mutator protein MutT